MNLELENDNIELETDNQWQQYYDYMQWLCIHKSCTDTENFIIDSIIVEMTTGAVSDVNFAEITTFPPKGISGLLLIIVSSSRPAPKSNAISATKSLLSNLSLTERENVPSVSIALACNGRKCPHRCTGSTPSSSTPHLKTVSQSPCTALMAGNLSGKLPAIRVVQGFRLCNSLA